MNKSELKEIVKKSKHIHGKNVTSLRKRELLKIVKHLYRGGCDTPNSPTCPKNMLVSQLYKKYGIKKKVHFIEGRN
jgi:hypothetical protein